MNDYNTREYSRIEVARELINLAVGLMMNENNVLITLPTDRFDLCCERLTDTVLKSAQFDIGMLARIVETGDPKVAG